MEVGQNGFCSILRQVPWTRELLEDLERDLQRPCRRSSARWTVAILTAYSRIAGGAR